MERIDQLEEDFNEDLANIKANLGNLNFNRRHDETDSEVTDSDLDEEEEIQESMAEAMQRVRLSRFVGATGVRANARTEDEIDDNINTTRRTSEIT